MEFSYKNIYNSDKYKKFTDGQRYVIDDKFLYRTENCKLSDGFSLEVMFYEEDRQKENDFEILACVNKCILKKSDKVIYEYCCFDNNNYVFKDIIHHRNGHRYFLFKVDLYGISCLDVDTLEVYNYIPEGYEHDEQYRCGESFIITDVHYDEKSNLIAYGGRYLSLLYDVMVGDFSNPLGFNPHLVRMHDISDPEYEYDEIDFSKWKDGRLFIMCDGLKVEEESFSVCRIKEEKSVSVEELRKLIDELTMKGK